MIRWRAIAAVGIIGGTACAAIAAPLPAEDPGAKHEAERLNNLPPVPPAPPGHIDHTGRKQRGKASFYANRFAHRKMADGHRMVPNSDIAASKTLPLGSVAKVTNLENGKTATVKIEDRGPYVDGRVVDLAPKVADQLDMKQQGVAPVEVKPITLPRPDGEVKLGAGAAEASPQEVKSAVETTKELTTPKTTETVEK
ncbi:MAG: septal ring lytic transglycosylase RlpA family protein [Rhodopila sp.]|nr:septal ring lytic transglycosylase RlpA family protein [Rhodopila sp.]